MKKPTLLLRTLWTLMILALCAVRDVRAEITYASLPGEIDSPTNLAFTTQMEISSVSNCPGAFSVLVQFDTNVLQLNGINPSTGSPFAGNLFVSSDYQSGQVRVVGFQTSATNVLPPATVLTFNWQSIGYVSTSTTITNIIETSVDAAWAHNETFSLTTTVGLTRTNFNDGIDTNSMIFGTQMVSHGGLRISVTGGVLGQNYNLLASTNLKDWSPILGYVYSNRVIDLMDPDATNYPRRYYRLALANPTNTQPPAPAPFFRNQALLGSNWYYLHASGNTYAVGYYNLGAFPYIYHLDLGWEYFVDAGDTVQGAYFYDFSDQVWFYTAPGFFPSLYDFHLNSWIWHNPLADSVDRYTSNPRSFYNFSTHTNISHL